MLRSLPSRQREVERGNPPRRWLGARPSLSARKNPSPIAMGSETSPTQASTPLTPNPVLHSLYPQKVHQNGVKTPSKQSVTSLATNRGRITLHIQNTLRHNEGCRFQGDRLNQNGSGLRVANALGETIFVHGSQPGIRGIATTLRLVGRGWAGLPEGKVGFGGAREFFRLRLSQRN